MTIAKQPKRPQPKITINLVHGTWGRGLYPRSRSKVDTDRLKRRWFEDGSRFRSSLSKELARSGIAHEFRPFLWSGANSVRERDFAAKELATRLQSQQNEVENAQQVIISHSHGGNIALRALYHLIETKSTIYIVTIATPFLQLYEKSGERRESDIYRNVIKALVIPLSWVVLGAIGATASRYLLFDEMAAFHPLLSLVFALFTFLILLLIVFLLTNALVTWVANPWIVPPDSGDPGALQASERDFRPITIADLASYPEDYYAATHIHETFIDPLFNPQYRFLEETYQRTKAQILVLRGIDDEASLALAAGAIGARVATLLLSFISWFGKVSWVLMGAAITLLTVIQWGGHRIIPADFEDTLWLLGLVLVSIIGMINLTVIFLPGLFKSVYGRELLFGMSRIDVAANSVPDLKGDVQVETLPTRALSHNKIIHQLYDHPWCTAVIVRWLKERITFDYVIE